MVCHCLILVVLPSWEPAVDELQVCGLVSRVIQVQLQGALTPGVGRLELVSGL